MLDKSQHDAEQKKEKEEKKEEDKRITTADEGSFPASDSPPWTVDRTGGPKRNGDKQR